MIWEEIILLLPNGRYTQYNNVSLPISDFDIVVQEGKLSICRFAQRFDPHWFEDWNLEHFCLWNQRGINEEIKNGDRIKYRRTFLKSLCASAVDPMWRWRGIARTFEKLDDTMLVTVFWDERFWKGKGDGIPYTKINVKNITHESALERDE